MCMGGSFRQWRGHTSLFSPLSVIFETTHLKLHQRVEKGQRVTSGLGFFLSSQPIAFETPHASSLAAQAK